MTGDLLMSNSMNVYSLSFLALKRQFSVHYKSATFHKNVDSPHKIIYRFQRSDNQHFAKKQHELTSQKINGCSFSENFTMHSILFAGLDGELFTLLFVARWEACLRKLTGERERQRGNHSFS